jgi:hypothetical protein
MRAQAICTRAESGCFRPSSRRFFAAMTEAHPDSAPVRHGAIVTCARETAIVFPPVPVPLTSEGAAALAAARDLARNASAPVTLRAYKADWTHFSDWCAAKGFVPVPAAPEVMGAYLASSHEGRHAIKGLAKRPLTKLQVNDAIGDDINV